jgi:hypothetical protein
MTARRLRLGVVIWLCVLAGGLTVGGVSAGAAVTHEYLPEASRALTDGVPAGSGVALTGPVTGLGPMTVDSGHLWVAEHVGSTSGVFRVDEFDAGTGAFVSQLPQVPGFEELGLAVAVASGRVYVGAQHVPGGEGGLAVFSEAGSLLGSWTGTSTPAGSFSSEGPSDVAVDRSVSGLASGSVYVDVQKQRVVDVFKAEGVGKEPPVVEPSAGPEHFRQLTGTCPVEGTTCEPGEVIAFNNPRHVAVDASSGHVLVFDTIEEKLVGRSVIDVFEPEVLGGYVFVRQIKLPLSENALSLGVDGGSSDIYVAAEGGVDQFSSTGVFLGRITGETTPAGNLRSTQAVTVDPGSHHVFVGDYRESGTPHEPSVIDVFGPDLVIPDVATDPATGVTRNGAVLNGTIKLDKEGEATCRFVWGTTTEFGQTAPCPTPVTEEESAVQSTLSKATESELEPDTTYYYRLQARNKNGLNLGEPSQDQQFTTSGPGIHEESVSNVAATSVTFDATINPHNVPTTAYFQYGTTSGYGTNVPATPGLSLGSGEGDVEVTPQHVQGLEAGTIYHYRVVAISESSPGLVEEFDGADQTFTTQRSGVGGGGTSLLDGRAWEMVTPPDKKGALFYHIYDALMKASVGGDAIADMASAPTEVEPRGYPTNGVSVLSTRGGNGWSSQVISPPHNLATPPAANGEREYRFFSEDLSLGVMQPFGSVTPLSPQASEATAYLRTDYLNGDVDTHCQNECFTPLVTAANTPPGTAFGEEPSGHCTKSYCGPYFWGGTPDLSHIILSSPVQLTSTPDTYEGLYEWAADGLHLVSVLPLAEGGAAVPAEPSLGQHDSGDVRHAVSDDGSRVIWEALFGGSRHLYVRDVTGGETVRLDLAQGGVDRNSSGPIYMTASSNGSKVFFLSEEHLTSGSSSGGDDLYEYDLNAPLGSRLTDLSVDRHAGETANVAQVLGASEDGSYLYFAAGGMLAAGAKNGRCGGAKEGEEGSKEMCNIYVRHAGVTSLVVELSSEDFADWSDALSHLPVRVSSDGRWLAFMSKRNLTGYVTTDAVKRGTDEEVYLYDSSIARLVCASCNPTGARPVGLEYGDSTKLVDGDRVWSTSSQGRGTLLAANVPGWTPNGFSALYQSRYLSDSGRLFFNSNDALVPQDVNGTEDVYEYEPPGVGGCNVSQASFSERSGGCVNLMSSGTSAEESAFLDASGTGGDVFFLTAAKLASQDFDTALDVYDAHECTTGAPCFASVLVSPPACSTGDSCKPAPSPQPALFGSPSSATFSGAGNVTPSGVGPALGARSLTRGQKLARALRACAKKRNRGQRDVCKQKARKRYGPGKSRKANATKKSGR